MNTPVQRRNGQQIDATKPIHSMHLLRQTKVKWRHKLARAIVPTNTAVDDIHGQRQNCEQKDQNKTLMFCSTGRACFRRFFVDRIAGRRHEFSRWGLENTAAALGVIYWHWLRTAKYFKVLQVFEDSVIEWVPVYLYSSVPLWGR